MISYEDILTVGFWFFIVVIVVVAAHLVYSIVSDYREWRRERRDKR